MFYRRDTRNKGLGSMEIRRVDSLSQSKWYSWMGRTVFASVLQYQSVRSWAIYRGCW